MPTKPTHSVHSLTPLPFLLQPRMHRIGINQSGLCGGKRPQQKLYGNFVPQLPQYLLGVHSDDKQDLQHA